MPAPNQRCENCLYWAPTEPTVSVGECRRRAPPASGAHLHPETCADHWCGEWGPLPAPQKAPRRCHDSEGE